MVKFEKISKYADVDIPLPTRATANSAGYDFVVAEDIVIPPIEFFNTKIRDKVFEDNKDADYYGFINPLTLDDLAAITKDTKSKVTLVPTGMKCALKSNQYLELSVRSSTPLKHWLVLANGVGIIDADYYSNQDNDGHIFFQLINLSPVAIQLRRGDKIGQGIIKTYEVTDDDTANGIRSGGMGSTDE